MKKLLIVVAIIFMVSVISGDARDIKSQIFSLTKTFIIKAIPHDAKEIKFWMPYPLVNNQYIIRADFQVPGTYSFVTDSKHNNKIFCAVCKNEKKGFLKISATYEIERKEWLNNPKDLHDTDQVSYPKEVLQYLEGSTFAIISPRIRELAKKITAGKKTPLSSARTIYDYVLENMEYNKAVPGWGNGDSERACIISKGNCTDFHSLFNSLARASNIPAKFVIGFSIPKEKQAEINGYHCWAAFYLNKHGWIPVDIAEAWKNKSKRDYYFGNLDENRIGFTVGRDIILNPHSNSLPLNYFIYPYVEIDGQPTANIEISIASKLL